MRATGEVFRTEALLAALQRWLSRRARRTLVPRLEALAVRHGFDAVRKTSVRNQRSCWASCSPSGAISINRKLLFLTPEQMEYVLIHELCHTAHPNHSQRFWRLVAARQPHYRELERSLASDDGRIPTWALV